MEGGLGGPMNKLKRLKGRRVLITGGASGIGAATAERFLSEGATVCILDSNSSACERMKHEHVKLDGFVVADVSDRAQVEDGFRRVLL